MDKVAVVWDGEWGNYTVCVETNFSNSDCPIFVGSIDDCSFLAMVYRRLGYSIFEVEPDDEIEYVITYEYNNKTLSFTGTDKDWVEFQQTKRFIALNIIEVFEVGCEPQRN